MNRIFIVESRSETDSTDCAGSSDNDTDYVPFNENDTIAVDEDISHEYFNNQKRYVASQVLSKEPEKAGEKLLRGKVWFEIANYKDEFYISVYYENL